jgi:hypothetical protein
MLLAEDLLVLLIPRSSGELPKYGGTQSALAAALLVELEGKGRLEVDEDLWTRLVDGTPLGEPLLDDPLATLDEDGEPVADVVTRLVPGIHVNLLDRLAEQGVLTPRARAPLSLASKYVWRLADAEPRERLRFRLAAVLSNQLAPDQWSGSLISLLYAVNAVDLVAEGEQCWERAEEISRAHWCGEVVTHPRLDQPGGAAVSQDLAPIWFA